VRFGWCRCSAPWAGATLLGHRRRIVLTTWCTYGCTEFRPVVGMRCGSHREETLFIPSSWWWRTGLHERYLGHATNFPWRQTRMVLSTHRLRIRRDRSFTLHGESWISPCRQRGRFQDRLLCVSMLSRIEGNPRRRLAHEVDELVRPR
jgi:hypothetical protein